MGCAGSRFDELPVTGHTTGLAVIPTSTGAFYLRPQSTVLRLREKILSFSGDDCSVKVQTLFYIFENGEILIQLLNT